MVTSSVEAAQKRVEGSNYDSRKQVLQYDDVLRMQREIIYKDRNEILEMENVGEIVNELVYNSVVYDVQQVLIDDITDEERTERMKEVNSKYSLMIFRPGHDLFKYDPDSIAEQIGTNVIKTINKVRKSEQDFYIEEKHILLDSIDKAWTAHIDQMDQLRKGIFLRTYAQIDPLKEYKNEGYAMFEDMKLEIADNLSRALLDKVKDYRQVN